MVAFIVLIGIVLIGIVFDSEIARVTVTDEKPFHSMAASKVKGAKSSLMLIRNASRVSNVCNDVVGDICGIISGARRPSSSLRLNFRREVFSMPHFFPSF